MFLLNSGNIVEMNKKYPRIDLKPSWIQEHTKMKGINRMKDLTPQEITFLTRHDVPLDSINIRYFCSRITSPEYRETHFITNSTVNMAMEILVKLDEVEFYEVFESHLNG
jgi:hypothetical protein